MSLPWFPFNINEYLSDTMALTTEEHGAYLLLMLHYYATETPPPDNDRKLAAICKVGIAGWPDIRESLAPYFEIKDGGWFHQRIHDEIRNGHDKHSAARARTAAATEAAAAKRHATKDATPSVTDNATPPQRPSRPPRIRGKSATPIVADDVTQSVTDTQKQKPLPSKNSLSASQDSENGQVKGGDNPFITDNWQPSDEIRTRCLAVAAQDIFEKEVRIFIAHCQENGTMSQDWNASFTKFWQRFLDYRTKQADAAIKPPRAPPRIMTTMQPDAENYDRAAMAFARNQSQWPRGLGPEPGQVGCKCPADILIKHGIDPTTGQVKRSVKAS